MKKITCKNDFVAVDLHAQLRLSTQSSLQTCSGQGLQTQTWVPSNSNCQRLQAEILLDTG